MTIRRPPLPRVPPWTAGAVVAAAIVAVVAGGVGWLAPGSPGLAVPAVFAAALPLLLLVGALSAGEARSVWSVRAHARTRALTEALHEQVALQRQLAPRRSTIR